MRHTVQIERLSQLGEGVAQLSGRTVFIPGALPGETVLAEVEEVGKVLRGSLREVVTPSPDRRSPGCALSGRCGGCDWLELSEAAQRRAKREIAISALEHLGGIPRESYALLPDVTAPRPMGYRRRAVMHFGKDQLGFFERGSHRHAAVERCPAMVAELAELPKALSLALAPLSKDALSVSMLSGAQGVAIAIALKGKVTQAHIDCVERGVRSLGLRGAVLTPKEGSPRLIGQPTLSEPHPLWPEVPLFTRPDAFVQASGEGNAGLICAAIDALSAPQGARVLELFSGNGNFTFALASAAAELLAVEGFGPSVELAQRSAREGGVSNVRLIQGDALKVARGLAKQGDRFEALLVDPPRTGVRGLGALARDLGVTHLAYVACDTSALARDAKELARSGFRPRSLQLVEMFPQTRHVEAVMGFRR